MKKVLFLVFGSVLLAGILFSMWTVDRIAVAYMTGQRRVPGKGVFGEDLPIGGPVPGYAFLGFTRASNDPPGLRIIRPWDSAREMGLSSNDVVTSVDGKMFLSAQELMSHCVQNYTAGETVPVTVVNPEGISRTLLMQLEAFIRDPGDLELPFEDVEFLSGSGFRLRGWFISPPERSDGRVAVFVHGANSSRFQALDNGAKYWYRRGYGLLTMDLSGRGSSEGDYIAYTVNERHDVTSMLDWVRSRPEVDPRRVVLFGTSNGAAASIYAAAADETLPGLVLDAPYADLSDAAASMLNARGSYPSLRHLLFLAVRLRTGIDLSAVRPIDVVEHIFAPILFVHGDNDKQVPVAHSLSMHEKRERVGLPSELWVLPGGEHGFDNYPPEGIFWNRILDFFDRSLGGPPEAWNLSL